MTPTTAEVALGTALTVVLVAFAGSLREVYRLRRLLRQERQHSDWQKQYLDRVGWRSVRRDAGHQTPNAPHGPRLWRHEPPRQG